MENDDTQAKENEKQVIIFTFEDMDKTKFDLIPGKETLMLFSRERFDLSL